MGESAFIDSNNLLISAEFKSEPNSWHKEWNPNYRPMIWTRFKEEALKITKKYNKMPDWLLSVIEDDSKFNQKLPLHNLLKDSLYYPCCCIDTRPINDEAGYIYSYVYADLWFMDEKYLSWSKSLLREVENYGYDYYKETQQVYTLIKQRRVDFNEIIPRNWKPSINPIKSDGNIERLLEFQKLKAQRYVYWSIWKRNNIDESMPIYFSLLYLGGCEMNAAYQALYNRLNVKPKVISLINPGMGFWDEKEINGHYITHNFFFKVVRGNLAGLPQFLISGDNTAFMKFYNEKTNTSYGYPKYKLKPEFDN